MRLARLSFIAPVIISFVLALSVQTARAECNCVAVAGDVAASIQAEVAKADGLYARGDYDAALAIYAKAYGTSKDSALVYAQAMANVQLGMQDKAKALFQQYLSASGALAYKDKAQAHLGVLGGATAAVSTGAHTIGGLGGDIGRVGGGVAGDVGGTAAGTVGGAVGTTAGVAGSVHGDLDGKTKVGKTAGIVLGVIAIAALGAVAIHGIAAGLKDDIELDPKFDLGMGIAGVSVGISAIYVGGLTAATGAAAGAPCLGMPQTSNTKQVGLAAGFRF